MKANNYISKREHKLLLIFAFAAVIYVLSTFSWEVAKTYNHSVVEEQQEIRSRADGKFGLRFSGGIGANTMPGLHFLTLFIFIALLKTKRFLLSSFLTIFYAVVFIYGLSVRYYGSLLGGEEFSPKGSFFERLYREANSFDYLAALFISILLFWQISILLRMLVKTLQKDEALP
jgi:hypothetical protein